MINVRISDLSKFASCQKRAKIQGLRQSIFSGSKTRAMIKGNEMHAEYSSLIQEWEHDLLKSILKRFDKVAYRCFDNYEIRGVNDDFQVIFHWQTKEKYVRIYEVKTTGQPRLWSNEEAVAVLQLELYLWVYEPIYKQLGYKLANMHFVEIYSQQTGELLKRVKVVKVQNMEKLLRFIFNQWIGLEPITYPPEFICRHCPKEVRCKCGRYMNGRNN